MTRIVRNGFNGFVTKDGSVKWSHQYKKCRLCGTVEIKHCGKGFCRKCYEIYKKRTDPEKHYRQKRESGKKYQDKLYKEGGEVLERRRERGRVHANTDRCKKNRKIYYQKNKEELSIKNKEYYQRKKKDKEYMEKRNKSTREWQLKNKDLINKRRRDKRAFIKSLETNSGVEYIHNGVVHKSPFVNPRKSKKLDKEWLEWVTNLKKYLKLRD